MDAKRTREALSSVRPMPGRGRIHALAGVTIVDESYNASPASMTRSLAMLGALPARRRIAVLGDMKELGDATAALHRSIGAEIGANKIDRVFWMGSREKRFAPLPRPCARTCGSRCIPGWSRWSARCSRSWARATSCW